MRTGKRHAPFGTITAFVILLVLVVYQRYQPSEANHPPAGETREPAAKPSYPLAPNLSAAPRKVDGYDGYEGCTLLENRGNDGDSFHVGIPGRGDMELRLYYVDAPESYRHQFNGERISDQARYFGITGDAAVDVGLEAKSFVRELLAKAPFTVFTKWEKVYDSGRYYAFVQVNHGGRTRWLDEVLVDKGYVRIHTKGAKVPGGDDYGTRRKVLVDREKTARENRLGAWRR